MKDLPSQIFFPENYQELFALWDNHREAVLFAGGTAIIRENKSKMINLPPVIISLDKMDEMHRISRSERYLEIGAMVTLSRIVNLGKIVPGILRDCLKSIGGLQLRNMATIGGNICYCSKEASSCWMRDSTAALGALEAQFELRSAQTSRWISAMRFASFPGTAALESQELLTRIRIPLENWDFSSYKKFARQPNNNMASVFLVKIQKRNLNDMRIIYKTDVIRRDRNSESILNGKNLPLTRRIAADFIEHCEAYLSGTDGINEFSMRELVSFVERNVYSLTE